MSIKNIQIGVTGLAAVDPSFIYISTTDTFSTVTTTGYLNGPKREGYVFSNEQAALVYTTDLGAIVLQVSIDNLGNVSLVSTTSTGDVQLPTTEYHIASYLNSTGGLGQDAGVAINAGSIQAGINGTAGGFFSYPAVANKGSLNIYASANTGNSQTVITNAAQGQSTNFVIPDPHVSSTTFLLADSASTQTINTGNVTIAAGDLTLNSGDVDVVSGNVFIDSGRILINDSPSIAVSITTSSTANAFLGLELNTAGGSAVITNSAQEGSNVYYVVSYPSGATVSNQGYFLTCSAANALVTGHIPVTIGPDMGGMGDSGIAASNVQLKSNIKAATTANIGGSGATVSIAVSGLTSSSVVTASVVNSSNAVSVQKVTPGSGAFTLVLSADPGATLVVNYIAFITAQ